ncbi:PTS sugar transporter subunit IIC [Entomoplasma freundtii]|nr:PTS transporter subunit EIIC [Entomoplasma freundtii]
MKNSDKNLNTALRTQNKKQKFAKFRENSMNGIIKVGSSVGNNRFLVAIRDAFMLPFTLTTGAAIPLIMSNVFFHKNSMIAGFIKSAKGDKDWTSEGLEWVHKLIGSPLENVFWAVMAGFAIYVAVGMGYFLAKSYGKDGIIAAALSVAVFFAMKPLDGVNQVVVGGDNAGEVSTFATNFLSTNGMLIALLASMLATWMYCKLMDVKWLVPKMPDAVPPMVAKAFGAIFVSAIVLTSFSFLNSFWNVLATEVDIRGEISATTDNNGVITTTTYSRQLATLFIALEFGLAKPLMGLSGNIGVTIVISFLVAFFWFFGIHGTNILTPVTAIIWDANVLRNTAYWSLWKTGRYGTDYWNDVINVSGVDQAGLMPIPMAGLGYVGGTGATLGFLIGLLIFTKSKVHKDIAKLSIVPGVFGINEPVNFGVPIVLNPVYFIPYTFGFVLTYTLGHVWILIHWIRPGVVWTPTMPYGLNVLFATDFDWWSILVSVIQLAISFLVWLPFVFIGPKYQEKVEEKARLKKEVEKQARLAAKAAKTKEQEVLAQA